MPETKYADSDGVSIAYQVIGRGTLDLVYVPGFVSHLEYTWELPAYERFLKWLASSSRPIVFDKRSTGLFTKDGRACLAYIFRALLDRPLARLTLGEGRGMALFRPDALPERTAPAHRLLIEAFAASPEYRAFINS